MSGPGSPPALGDLLADLVSLRENESFLARLFTRPPGDWAPLRELCSELPRVRDVLSEPRAPAEPMAAWLADPFADPRSGYCLVAVRSGDALRCDVALYNRARLTRGDPG